MRHTVLAASLLMVSPNVLIAQEHAHVPGMTHPPEAAVAQAPASAGQAAYAAIAEVVRLLQQDSTTDWSRVDIERLRQHLIDMDHVTLRAVVVRANVPGGATFTVTGQGRTVDAIRRMTRAHGGMMKLDGLLVSVSDIASGVRMTVTAAEPANATAEARIRGLGFIGLMTTGEHHGPHHLAMARGTLAGH